MAESPFGGFLQGYTARRELQAQKAREIADQVFREAQLKLNQDRFNQEKANDLIAAKDRDTKNTHTQQKLDDDLMTTFMKLNEDAYQFDTQQKRFEADRVSRESIAKIRADTQKEIADAKNLSLEERYTLTEAMRNADTPEAAAGLQDWIRSRLRGTPVTVATPAAGVPAAPPDVPVMPQGPLAQPQTGPMDFLNMVIGQSATTGQPAPQAFDPNQPFGGPAGAQARSRNAYADMIEQKAAHLRDQFQLDALKARASIAEQQARTKRLEVLTPEQKKIAQLQQKNLESQISTRAQEIALKERNAQWEHKYKESQAQDKKTLVGGSLDQIRTKMQTAGSAMVSKRKEIDEIVADVARMVQDRENGVKTLVPNGVIDGWTRDHRIRTLNNRLTELWSVHDAARANYQHYRGILEETGNLNVEGKPKPQPKPGAGRPGRSASPPARRGYVMTEEDKARKARGDKTFAKPGTKKETDEEIMARLRKKY
jgi:hypothetical protein